MLGRDGSRNAVSPDKGPPLSWSAEKRSGDALVRPASNIKWQARLGSSNFAAPVVAGGLVWVGTNNDRPRDPKVPGDAAVLMCFREKDGAFLWQYVSPRLPDREQDWPGTGINCSPLAEGDFLYFTTNRGEVLCLDVAPLRRGTGEPRTVWRLDMPRALGVHLVAAMMTVGQTCSPAESWKGRLFVTTGHGVPWNRRQVGNPEAPSLVCLDRDTGKVLWQDSSPGKDILHVQWPSPLVAEVRGRAQVIVAQGDGWVRSFDPASGQLIWRFDTNPKAAQGSRPGGARSYPLATPVLYQDRVYLANGIHPALGTPVRGRLWCIDATKEGDVSRELNDGPRRGKPNPNSGAVWCFEEPEDQEQEPMRGTLSSVAVHDGLVIAPEGSGVVHCLDARTGRQYWTHDTHNSLSGSPLIADGKVYVGDGRGFVTALALAREKKVLAHNDCGNRIRSSPVLANGVLYVAAGWTLQAIQAGGAGGRAPGHWPQWRGPGRDGVSQETGLLTEWPQEGPPLAWQATGLGDGVGSVAVAGGRVFVLGKWGDDEQLVALEEATGKKLWAAALGPAVKGENRLMRWLSQRTPTVDGDRVYAFTARGALVCLRATDGEEVWRKDYPRDFAGRTGPWGWCDRPLVDGDKLICTPGGEDATVVALDKQTGAVAWRCAVPDSRAAYSATTVAEVGDVRQYVCFLSRGLVGVAAKDGRLLWSYTRVSNGIGNSYTPLVRGDRVFCAGGYGTGLALLKLTADKGRVRAEEVWFKKQVLPPWHDGTLIVGDHVYLGTGKDIVCAEWATGRVLWQERGAVGGAVALAAAEGNLYLLSQQGEAALVAASPKGPALKGKLRLPGAVSKPGATTPALAGGRLYLRDDDRLFVYDLAEGARAAPGPAAAVTVPPGARPGPPPRARGEGEPDAVFVPTPQDVVEKMLDLAGVRKGDVVYDLGCGDGRIVVTAAKKYRCRAAGFDIDPECIRMARANVRGQEVGDRVTIEQKDLFTLELAPATVVALYLLPRMNERLVPQLEKLRPGARVVCHANPIPGIRPDQVATVVSGEDGLPHKVYLYTLPLRKAGTGSKSPEDK
jgi:outer membrane protein assembly factor BamB